MTLRELRAFLAKHDDDDDDQIKVMACDETDRIAELHATLGESEDGETLFVLVASPWIEPKGEIE